VGRVVHGTSCPWGEMSMGRVVHGASCLWGKMTVGRVVMGQVLMRRVVHGVSFDGARSPGTPFGMHLGQPNQISMDINRYRERLMVPDRV
jgi:hypothetical protein